MPTGLQQAFPGPVHAMFAGGGSGGHLMPSIALAERLLSGDSQNRCTFLISRRPVDRLVLEASGLAGDDRLRIVEIPALPGGALRHSPLRFLRSWRQSRRVVDQEIEADRPTFLLGTGGFVSVPAAFSARSRALPIYLFEANRICGRANRLLSRFARAAFTGLPMAESSRRSIRCSVHSTGCPLRQVFTGGVSAVEAGLAGTANSGTRGNSLPSGPLVILGGSQGAYGLSELVLQAMENAPMLLRDLPVLHQCPADCIDDYRERWRRLGIAAEVTAFVRNLPKMMQTASIVITRAGAVSLAELIQSDAPMIVVPLVPSADNHQLENALFLERENAALIINPRCSDAPQRLRAALLEVQSEPLRRNLREAAGRLASRDAAEAILQVLRKDLL